MIADSPMAAIELTGRLVSGQGVAQRYTREEWARDAFMTAAGIDPFPGTLNLSVPDSRERQRWIACRSREGILLPAPNPSFCDGRLFRAAVFSEATGHSVDGAVVVPMVGGYPEDQLEIIAALSLRDALCAADGTELLVRISLGG
jgi:CTP-dependent riboflavin kinase